MRILIVHNTLNDTGGGERVTLHIVKTLIEHGHDVVLGTVEKTDWKRVLKIINVKLPKIPEEISLTKELRAFGLYQRQILAFNILRYRSKYDLILNTHGDAMLVPADIVYMHFPTIVLLRGPWSIHTKYSKSTLWKLYFVPYEAVLSVGIKNLENSLILTNSKFSQMVIERYLNKKAVVVYPPVEIGDYVKCVSDDKLVQRKNSVVVISRFTPEKNLHLIPYIAKELQDIEFHIIGAVKGVRAEKYLSQIKMLQKKFNLRNIYLHPNASHEEKLKILSRSKVLLHLMPYEHFGIVVVEGQASGCVPVIHKSGGQWLDIAEEGKYGVGFDNLHPLEIADKIQEAIDKWSPKLARHLARHASKFSDKMFEKRIIKIIEIYSNM